MAKFRVKVVQSYTVIRSIIVEVEADTAADAVEKQEASDAPDFQLDGWDETWDLKSEEALSVDRPLEDQYPQHMGDRGTISPEDRR